LEKKRRKGVGKEREEKIEERKREGKGLYSDSIMSRHIIDHLPCAARSIF